MGSNESSLTEITEFPDDLKCVNCGELLSVLPIYFYINRGNICGRCPQNPNNDGYQNRALEEMMKLQKLPCRYKKNDCTEDLNCKDVGDHEKVCKFRQYSCPTIPLQCRWKGRRFDLKKHYEVKHKDMLMEPEKFLLCSLNKDSYRNVLIETMGKQFLLQMRYEKKILHCGLIYLVKPSENKQYEFTILFRNGEREYRQTLSNSRFLDTYLVSNKDLCAIDFDKLDLLVNNSKSMDFQVTIKEDSA